MSGHTAHADPDTAPVKMQMEPHIRGHLALAVSASRPPANAPSTTVACGYYNKPLATCAVAAAARIDIPVGPEITRAGRPAKTYRLADRKPVSRLFN